MSTYAPFAVIPHAVRTAYATLFSQVQSVTSLQNAGGMSGAELFLLHTPTGNYCLRHWPAEHPSATRLAAIHAAVIAAAQRGITFLAVPIFNEAGVSATWLNHRAWEVSAWLDGAAETQTPPRPQRVVAAAQALAKLHQAWRGQPWPGFQLAAVASAPGLTQRIGWLDQLLAGEAMLLAELLRNSAPTTLREHAVKVLANFTPLANRWQQELHAAVAMQVPLQVCLRDIWRPHVLFTHDEVTGMIDYGALNMDSVAADIARLFDSLLGEDIATWNIALTAYEAVRPLLSTERTLVAAYQKSSILLTGMQWVTWLFREGRQFAPGHAEQRLQLALARMQTHQILVTDGS